MRFVLLLAMVAGCEKGSSHEVGPVSMQEAQAFAAQFGSAAKPCDVNKVAELIDGQVMASHLSTMAEKRETQNAIALMQHPVAEARLICEMNQNADSYQLLHVLGEDGHPRVVMRRLLREPRKHIVIVGYDRIDLGKSNEDHKVRMTELYSVTSGMTLSGLLAQGMDAFSGEGFAGGLEASETLKAVRDLNQQGKNVEALAKLDSLPPAIRKARMVQLMRVHVAEAISVEAYKQAIEEIMKVFPNDPSIAQLATDEGFLTGDYDTALANIDLIDRAVGGDAFQDAIRAQAYLKRGKPGDLDLAWQRAEAAVKTEPTLAKGWYSRLDVAVARKDYAAAIATIERLRRDFQAKLDDATLHKIPSYADFVASPEYQAWNSRGG